MVSESDVKYLVKIEKISMMMFFFYKHGISISGSNMLILKRDSLEIYTGTPCEYRLKLFLKSSAFIWYKFLQKTFLMQTLLNILSEI